MTVGDNFFMNVNGRLMDSGKITIGNNVFIAPDVCIITEEHAMDAAQRAAGREYTHPVTIGDNVWSAAGALVLRALPEKRMPGRVFGCTAAVCALAQCLSLLGA